MYTRAAQNVTHHRQGGWLGAGHEMDDLVDQRVGAGKLLLDGAQHRRQRIELMLKQAVAMASC
jgi:hypothetical protein